MSLAMNLAEREAFLSDLHVGVISIHESGRGPLSAPVGSKRPRPIPIHFT